MELTLNLPSIAGLIISLALLAAIPSISLLMVTTRAAVYGFRHGIAVASGIVLVDLLFISIALYGMTLILPWLGRWELLIRLFAAGYLCWMAVRCWRGEKHKQADSKLDADVSLTSSFLLGVIVTLADHKAILFYMGFFPVWINLNRLTLSDTLIIYMLTLCAVGSVKVFYAYMATKTATVFFTRTPDWFNKLVAIMLSTLAAIMLLSTWLN